MILSLAFLEEDKVEISYNILQTYLFKKYENHLEILKIKQLCEFLKETNQSQDCRKKHTKFECLSPHKEKNSFNNQYR
jgi:hypothetical protein